MTHHSIKLIGLLLCLLFKGFEAHAFQPNIVIFLVDDMGVMDTSLPFLTDASGAAQKHELNAFYRTPNMERLASRGIRFNQFCAMSVCSPTRIAIQTGQNAVRHGATNWINPDQNNAGPNGPPNWNWEGLKKGDVTLASVLREKGYRTLHVGKAHFGPRAFEGADPTHLGFDVNVGGASIGAPGSYYGAKNFDRTPNGKKKASGSHAVPGMEKYHGQEIFLTEALTLEAKSLVSESVKAGKPFFLNFAHYAVHSPFDSDPRFAANYSKSGKSPQAQAFASLIEGMDKSLGDLLDHLEGLGVAGNTLIFFLGDNGTDAPLGHEHAVACAAPLRGKKGSHYEGGMRVPFIASWAKVDETNPYQQRLPIPAGGIQRQQAAVQDLFPTVLMLTEAKAPSGHVVDGKPLQTLLTGKPDASRDETFLMHYPHAPHRSAYFTSFRQGEWKVVYHYFPSEASSGSHYQLFHLKADPYEQSDLTGSQPEKLKEMMTALSAALEQHQARYPVDPESRQAIKPVVP
jgi:arylsulfatase A-like enzyme